MVKNEGSKIGGKNAQKWPKMAKNGQKWAKIGIFSEEFSKITETDKNPISQLEFHDSEFWQGEVHAPEFTGHIFPCWPDFNCGELP